MKVQIALSAVGVDLSENPSEAEAIHALFAVGRSVLNNQVMSRGYAALAESLTDEDREISRAIGRRAGRLSD